MAWNIRSASLVGVIQEVEDVRCGWGEKMRVLRQYMLCNVHSCIELEEAGVWESRRDIDKTGEGNTRKKKGSGRVGKKKPRE